MILDDRGPCQPSKKESGSDQKAIHTVISIGDMMEGPNSSTLPVVGSRSESHTKEGRVTRRYPIPKS